MLALSDARIRDASKHVATDLRLRPHDYRDMLIYTPLTYRHIRKPLTLPLL